MSSEQKETGTSSHKRKDATPSVMDDVPVAGSPDSRHRSPLKKSKLASKGKAVATKTSSGRNFVSDDSVLGLKSNHSARPGGGDGVFEMVSSARTTGAASMADDGEEDIAPTVHLISHAPIRMAGTKSSGQLEAGAAPGAPATRTRTIYKAKRKNKPAGVGAGSRAPPPTPQTSFGSLNMAATAAVGTMSDTANADGTFGSYNYRSHSGVALSDSDEDGMQDTPRAQRASGSGAGVATSSSMGHHQGAGMADTGMGVVAPHTPAGPTGPALQRGLSETFENLLEEFASLGFAANKTETCPICFVACKLGVFATHVYACLQRMEDEDMARRLQQSEYEKGRAAGNKSLPTLVRDPFRAGDDVPRCRHGLKCTAEQGTYHFQQYVHPSTHPFAQATPENHPDCVVCAKPIPLPLLDAHVNQCLEASEAEQKMGAGAMTDDVEMPTGGATHSGSGFPVAPLNAGPGAASGAAGMHFGPMRDSGVGMDSDDDDDEPQRGAAQTGAGTSAGAGASVSGAPGLMLSTEQISACASLALRVRAAERHSESKARSPDGTPNQSPTGPGSPTSPGAGGFARLLDNLARLGITEDNLKQRIADIRGAQGGAGQSGNPSSASSLPPKPP